MFQLTLLDHLRLTFGHVVYRHKVHSQLAHSRVNRSRWLRATEALLVAGAAVVAFGAAFGRGPAFAWASAALAALALVTVLVQLALDLDRSGHAHAACAVRLWYIREQYRVLLSDLTDGAIEIDEARRRRDILIQQLHGIYEHVPPEDVHAYQAAAKAVGSADEGSLSDEEIDLFLPKSLHRTEKSATA
jgi:SMODS and SLOG-associating 2TM effector domain family 4